MTRVVLDLPDGVVSLLDSVEENLARECLVRFAVTLYGEGKVSLGKAVEISGLPYVEFMQLLGKYGLGINYTIEDFQDDLRVLEEMKSYGKGNSGKS